MGNGRAGRIASDDVPTYFAWSRWRKHGLLSLAAAPRGRQQEPGRASRIDHSEPLGSRVAISRAAAARGTTQQPGRGHPQARQRPDNPVRGLAPSS